MAHWFSHAIVETGRLPLFCFFLSLIVGFGVTRLSVRLIRAGVGWLGNVESGGLHIHHVVFGVILVVISGVAMIALPLDHAAGKAFLAAIFGVGTALMLDEFALILHLRDVYWSEAGRLSVDAIFVAASFAGLLLLGINPSGISDIIDFRYSPDLWTLALSSMWLLVHFGITVLVLLKGKIWTGLFGLFFSPLLYFGAIRVARPASPWARWRYPADSPKLAKAQRREQRIRRPMIRAKIRVQELISGRPDAPQE